MTTSSKFQVPSSRLGVPSSKLSLLAGVLWNLKRWIELKQWAQRTGNPEAFKNALAGIARCKDTCRKVRAL